MSKLNNVKAVNQMIRGEHRTQTRKSKGYEKKSIERQVGDTWEDANGQSWVQKNGYKAKVSRLSNIRAVIEQSVCPVCSKHATRFDKQFITREGKCHDCIVKEETLMSCEGYIKKEPIYQQWERNKIKKNVESFLKDASKDVELLKQKFTKSEYVNSDGTIDKWKIPESVKSIEQSIDKQFGDFKDQLLEKLKQGDKNVGIKKTTTE
tara:strand:- start:119 stop:739 length:621 start_codon:yes stop_codon:yes gene_type:complete